MLLKLGRDVVPYEIYQMVHILMLPWQRAWFQSLPFQNQMLPFAAAHLQFLLLLLLLRFVSVSQFS